MCIYFECYSNTDFHTNQNTHKPIIPYKTTQPAFLEVGQKIYVFSKASSIVAPFIKVGGATPVKQTDLRLRSPLFNHTELL